MSSFFFQAEDGIRDRNVTGVQTCALPICGDLQLLAIFSVRASSQLKTSQAGGVVDAGRNVLLRDAVSGADRERRVNAAGQPESDESVAVSRECFIEDGLPGRRLDHGDVDVSIGELAAASSEAVKVTFVSLAAIWGDRDVEFVFWHRQSGLIVLIVGQDELVGFNRSDEF